MTGNNFLLIAAVAEMLLTGMLLSVLLPVAKPPMRVLRSTQRFFRTGGVANTINNYMKLAMLT